VAWLKLWLLMCVNDRHHFLCDVLRGMLPRGFGVLLTHLMAVCLRHMQKAGGARGNVAAVTCCFGPSGGLQSYLQP
jgi:hypothetical protein